MSARYPLVRNSKAFATRFGVLISPSRFGSSPSSFSSCLISSCIRLFYPSGSPDRVRRGARAQRARWVAVVAVAAVLLPIGRAAPLIAQATDANADALYARRTDLASAERAADLWAAA